MREIEDDPSTKVTVLLPRRTYAPLVGRCCTIAPRTRWLALSAE